MRRRQRSVQDVVSAEGPRIGERQPAPERLPVEVGPQPVAEVDREGQAVGDDDDRHARRGSERIAHRRAHPRRHVGVRLPPVGQLTPEVAVRHGAVARCRSTAAGPRGAGRRQPPRRPIAGPPPWRSRGPSARCWTRAGRHRRPPPAGTPTPRAWSLAASSRCHSLGWTPSVDGGHGVANVGDAGHGHARPTVAVELTR